MNATQVTGNDLSNPAVGWLVGLVFSSFGLALLGYDLWELSRAIEAASWEEIEATLDTVEVGRTNKGSVRVRTLSYHYRYASERYDSQEGSLYGLFGGHFHSRAFILDGMRERGEPHPCFVDPNNPNRALLDRTVSAAECAMMTSFSMAFIVMGFGALSLMAVVGASEREVMLAAKRLPKEPWNWLPDWRERKIAEERPRWPAALLALALIPALGFGAGIVAVVFAKTNGGTLPPYFMGLAISTVVGAYAAFVLFGGLLAERSVLVLEENPILRGKSLRGSVRLARNTFAVGDRLVAKLQCCQATPTLTVYGVAKVYWQAKQEIEPTWREGRGEFSITIPIPYDPPAFDRTEGIDTIWWLEVRRAGLQYGRCARFIVPVF